MAFNIFKDKRGMSTTTEMIILIFIISVIVLVVGTTIKDSLNSGAAFTGDFIQSQYNAING